MNTFNRPGEAEIPAERYGVKADGVTDDAPAIQAIIDAVEADTKAGADSGDPLYPYGPKTIRLPRGKVRLGAPLVMGAEQRTGICGDPSGLTSLMPQYGSGHALVVAPRQPFGLDLEPSLVPGPGNAIRLGAGRNGVDLSTEPQLDLSGLAELTVEYFFRRAAPASDAAVHVHAGNHLLHDAHDCLGVWDYFGRLAVYWGDLTPHTTEPGVAQAVGVTYHVALTFKNSVVSLWVGEPGQESALVASFTAPSAVVPAQALGIDRFCVGFNGKGPDGHALRSHAAGEYWLDGLRVSDVCRYDAPFTCPTEKPAADPASRIVVNGERRGVFLYGETGKRGTGAAGAYIYPPPRGDYQGGGHRVSDLTIEGHQGASGLLLCGSILSTVERYGTVGAWQGLTFRGSTYGGRFEDINLAATSFAWCQTGQSMETVVGRLVCTAARVLYYTAGPVGGVVTFLVLNPKTNTIASMVIDGGNENLILSGQIDDEGETPGPFAAAIHVKEGTLTIPHGQLVRQTPGHLVECSAGGTFETRAWLHCPDGAIPMIRFRDEPHSPPDIRPCRRATTAPLTDHPEYLQFPPHAGIGS